MKKVAYLSGSYIYWDREVEREMQKDRVMNVLPRSIRTAVGREQLDISRLQELRLRAEKPLILICDGRERIVRDQRIIVKIRGGIARIDAEDLYYVESRNHTMIYHTAEKNIEASGTMKDAEDMLVEFHFCRGNKGYLINLAHVDSIQNDYAVVRGEKLLLSRARKNAFMEELTNYWGEVK